MPQKFVVWKPAANVCVVRLSLLGDFRLEIEGVEQRIASRKARLLLARLALERGGAVSRAALLGLFWGDRPNEQASGSLRGCLAELRRSLGAHADLIRGGDGALTLDLGRIEVDAVELARLAGAPDAALALPLLRGELLEHEGCPEPELDDWLETERRRYRHLATLILDAALDGAVRARAHARAIEIALRALAIEPLREPVHRNLMRIFAASDEPARALRQYKDLQERLRAELGVAPEPETVRLFEAIRARRLLPRPGAIAEDAATSREPTRFCQTKDGVRLAFAVSGRGLPLVRSVHMMTHVEYERDCPVWHHWTEGLSDRFRLHRYDGRGNGLSDREVRDLSFEALVDDLETVIDAAGLDRCVLFGISQGCAVSIAYALRHPHKVRGLVLYAGYARGWRARGDASETARRTSMNALMRQGWREETPAYRQMFTSLTIPTGSPEQMEGLNRLQRISVTPEMNARLSESFGEIDVTSLLARITCPTLVLHPCGDSAVPMAAGRELAAAIPHARFVALDSMNHIVLGDEPAFAHAMAEITQFADGIERPRVALAMTEAAA